MSRIFYCPTTNQYLNLIHREAPIAMGVPQESDPVMIKAERLRDGSIYVEIGSRSYRDVIRRQIAAALDAERMRGRSAS